MSLIVKDVVDGVRTAGAETPLDTITCLGLLLERASMSRYDDPSYAQLGLPPDWLAVRLTRSEFDDIIDVLADVLDAYPTLASTAAWALGKSFSDRATPRLISALERYWSSEDHVAHQLLIALENHGLERAESLVEQIAQTGLDESRELAIRLKAKIQRRRAIRSEGE